MLDKKAAKKQHITYAEFVKREKEIEEARQEKEIEDQKKASHLEMKQDDTPKPKRYNSKVLNGGEAEEGGKGGKGAHDEIGRIDQTILELKIKADAAGDDDDEDAEDQLRSEIRKLRKKKKNIIAAAASTAPTELPASPTREETKDRQAAVALGLTYEEYVQRQKAAVAVAAGATTGATKSDVPDGAIDAAIKTEDKIEDLLQPMSDDSSTDNEEDEDSYAAIVNRGTIVEADAEHAQQHGNGSVLEMLSDVDENEPAIEKVSYDTVAESVEKNTRVSSDEDETLEDETLDEDERLKRKFAKMREEKKRLKDARIAAKIKQLEEEKAAQKKQTKTVAKKAMLQKARDKSKAKALGLSYVEYMDRKERKRQKLRELESSEEEEEMEEMEQRKDLIENNDFGEVTELQDFAGEESDGGERSVDDGWD